MRKICASCKEEYEPSDESLLELNLTKAEVKGKQVFRGGCNNCRNIGYKGRLGIYEIMLMNNEIRRLITEQANTNVIRMAAKENGMRTLERQGINRNIQRINNHSRNRKGNDDNMTMG